MRSPARSSASGSSSTLRIRFSAAWRPRLPRFSKASTPQYTPHVDTGDFVIIINADKIRMTGTKAAQKTYYRHSGFPGGLRAESFAEAMEKHPERVLEHAIKGMLPKNTLGRAMGKKLKVYAGPEHPHAAQQPRKIEMEG